MANNQDEQVSQEFWVERKGEEMNLSTGKMTENRERQQEMEDERQTEKPQGKMEININD